MKAKILLFGMALFFLTFSSCNQIDDPNSSALNADETKTNAEIDRIAEDVSKIVEDQYIAQENAGLRMAVPATILPACATVTVAISGNIWTRTVDFGTTGCTMSNGNVLKGKIIASGSTDFSTASYTINYSFLNFYHNTKMIEGNKIVVRTLQGTTAIPAVHPFFDISLDMKVTYSNGNIYRRFGNRVAELIEGYDTPLVWLDNVYSVTGNWTTTLPNNSIQTSTITTPLRIQMNCIHVMSGVISIVRNNVTATLDYGSVACDNQATVLINGVTYAIILG